MASFEITFKVDYVKDKIDCGLLAEAVRKYINNCCNKPCEIKQLQITE